jgi:hypothetical protein
LEIGRATLDGWVMRVGESLAPITQAMRKDLLNAAYLQADETTVPVQMHDRRGSNHEAYLWQYGKPGGETVFDFCLGRGVKVRNDFWAIGKAFCKQTAIRPTKGWVAEDGACGLLGALSGLWNYPERMRAMCLKRGESLGAVVIIFLMRIASKIA